MANSEKTTKQLVTGRRYHEAGDFIRAEEYYRRILQREPGNIDALFFMAAVYIAMSRVEESVPLLEKVVVARPDWKEAQNNLAIAYHRSSRYDEAITQYDKAIAIDPEFVEPLTNKCSCFMLMGRKEDALETITRAVSIKQAGVNDRVIYASVLLDNDKVDEADKVVLDLLEKEVLPEDVLMKIGNTVQNFNPQAAARAYERAAEMNPKNAVALCRLAVVLDRTINLENRSALQVRMLELLDAALELDPNYVDAILNKSSILQRLRRMEESRDLLENHKDIATDRYDYYNNYGASLQDEARYVEAIESFKKAIEISPNQANPWYNWGACLQLQGQYEEAGTKFDKALSLEPNHVDSRTARSLINLVLGNFAEGWTDYEARKQNDQFTGRIIETRLVARGEIAGKRVLLHAEQGQGDTIQFVRYASVIKAMGGHVIVECHDGLKDIIETCPGVDTVFERQEITKQDSPVVFDLQANLMSLPYCLGTKSVSDIPSQVPYLTANEEKRTYWKARLQELTPPDTRLKVGIVWAGNPNHRTDLLRSISLSKFGVLSRIPGLVCFSIQKGEAAEKQLDSPPPGLAIVPVGPELKSFADTAALMEQLDLVIAVDTSVIHLAGAIGVPVWTLIAKSPDWRWMLNRDDSPWYPTMKLFRQREVQNWDTVLEDVANELERFAADPIAWQLDRAVNRFETGDRNVAKVEMLALARLHPTNTRVLNSLGTALWTDGDTQAALQTFLTALQINPHDRTTILNSGQVFAAFGQMDDARALYQHYLAAHPNDREFADKLHSLTRPQGRELAMAA